MKRTQHTCWDDQRFPAAAVNPPGLGSDPDFDSLNGGWLFAAGSTELLFIAAQLPHAWKVGTDLEGHVHWQKTTSAGGNVLWRLSYKWAPKAAVMDVAFTDLDASTVISATPDNDTANEHLITDFADISGTGKGISDMLMMKIARIGGDGADTYGADARLLEFDIHYMLTADQPGSASEYVKGQ